MVTICPRPFRGYEARPDMLCLARPISCSEDATALWPAGRGDIPPDGVKVCGDCWRELAYPRSDCGGNARPAHIMRQTIDVLTGTGPDRCGGKVQARSCFGATDTP